MLAGLIMTRSTGPMVNMSELSLSVTLTPLAVALSSTLVLLLIVWLIIRNITKSALILSLFLILFFSYGHVLNLAIELGIGKIYIGGVLVGTPARYILAIWAIVFVCGTYFILKTHRDLRKLSTFINIAVICMVVISLANIGVYELRRPNLAMEPYIFPESQSTVNNVDSESNNIRPDIYYIILDAYAGADMLEEFYDFNNSEFINYLITQGFYVASKSRSNYIPTGNSLASSLIR